MHHSSIIKNKKLNSKYIGYNLIICILSIFYNNALAGDFSIAPVHENKTIDCSKFASKNNSIKCLDKSTRTSLEYELKDVNIYYNGIKIYPYNFDVNKITKSIEDGKCSDIIANLFGSYYINNSTKSYEYMGRLFEKGICVNSDIGLAITLYEHAVKENNSNKSLINKLKNIKIEISKFDFQIFNNRNDMNECNNIKSDNSKIYCTDSGKYFDKVNVDSVYYKKSLIYPYDSAWKNNVEKSINTKDCKNIIYNIYGPALIDKLNSSYIYMAQMYEYGICVKNDNILALGYYKESLQGDNKDIAYEKITLITRQIEEDNKKMHEIEIKLKEEEMRIKMEERAASRKREAIEREMREERNKIDAVCERDCSVNKYQYSRSCHQACMQAHGVY